VKILQEFDWVEPISAALEVQPLLLKVPFFGLLYNYDPLLGHITLILYSQFPDVFAGQEGEVFRQFILISKGGQQPLVLMLLALHWLMGLVDSISNRNVEKRKLITGMRSNFYPNIYDALALKPLKLDLLALCSVVVDAIESCKGISKVYALNYFDDGFICVSAFKWPHPGSTETAVAFRTIHKVLIGGSSHSDNVPAIMVSAIFYPTQSMLVSLLLGYQKLVPVVVSLINRLLHCKMHSCLGKNLLQIFGICFLNLS